MPSRSASAVFALFFLNVPSVPSVPSVASIGSVLAAQRPNPAPLLDPQKLAGRAALYELRAGPLLLVGGGDISPEIAARFVHCAGGRGTRLVVIPGPSQEHETGARAATFWRLHGFAEVDVLHAKDRGEAEREEFCAPLRRADAVWLGGADPARLAELYVGTRVQQELLALLGRGGAVGGSAAGATIQTRVMITGGEEQPELRLGLGLLEGAIVAPHFAQPERHAHLEAAVASQRGHFGLGLDERAAVLIEGRVIRTLGEGLVSVALPKGAGRPASLRRAPARSQFDLIQLRRAARDRIDPSPPAWSPPTALASGTLWIAGGGAIGSDIWKRFVADCGPSARILVIPTAKDLETSADDVYALRKLEEHGATDVRVLHAPHWMDVDEEMLTELDRAHGVWISGGRQSHLVDRYERTGVVAALRRLLARGGVIGGNSAGASVLAECLVRGHPLTNRWIMAEGYERGFGFLPGTAIDQHFSERQRQAQLAEVKKRWPALLCLGIDERTAIRVQGPGFEVVGPGAVHVYDDRPEPARLPDGASYLLPRRP